MWSENTVYTNNIDLIKEYVRHRSDTMSDYLNYSKTQYFSMWYKPLYHSDLTTRGKRTSSTDGFERNLLYYMSTEDMERLHRQFPDRKFECAKQSNIGVTEEFYRDLGIPRIKRRSGKQTVQHSHILLNDYSDVYLVNDTLEYFNIFYTEKILNSLGKKLPETWRKNPFIADKDLFTPIELHEAVHGLGTEKDSVFHSLRLSMFLNDTIIFLIEHSSERPKLFILLDKNTMFYKILGIKDINWEKEENLRLFRENELIKNDVFLSYDELCLIK